MDSDQRLSTDAILSQFSDPDLASHAYLDLHFQKYKPLNQLPELHSQSSQLLSQLDHATEDLTWQLEDIMTELKKSGPRLTYQIELLKSGVAGLVGDIEEIAAPRVEEIKQKREREGSSSGSDDNSDKSVDNNENGDNSEGREENKDEIKNESSSFSSTLNKKAASPAAAGSLKVTSKPGSNDQENNSQNVSSNPTIARLQQLETVRVRMKQVESVLQRAQKFDEIELANTITRLLTASEDNSSSSSNNTNKKSENFEKALKLVEEAAELVQVWKGTSIYNGRAKFVAQLRKRIETALGQQDLEDHLNNSGSGYADGYNSNSGSGNRNSFDSREARARAGGNTPSRANSNSPASRPGTPKAQESDGYYGLFGQLSRKIGY